MAQLENRWVLCKGCGQRLGLLHAGVPPHLPPGTVAHTKPIGAPRVTCALYYRLGAEALITMHADAPSIEPPESLTPLIN